MRKKERLFKAAKNAIHMSNVTPVSDQEAKKFSFLFSVVEKSMGFVPNSLKTMGRQPAVLGSFTSLSGLLLGNPEKASPIMFLRLIWKNLGWSAKMMKRKDRVPLYLRNLVAHVSSNASGCRYCQAHTIGEALHNGASEEQIKAVWDFENSPLFSETEKVALRFGFAAGSVPNAVTNKHFVELKKHYSEEQIVELGAIISLFGFLNRWNDTFGTQLEDAPHAVAEKYLKEAKWEIGKHASIH